MRWSRSFLPTLRDDPADAEATSHKLMVRAGLIRQLGAGIYSWLPLGKRVMRKVEAVIRDEMESIGAQEFLLPALLRATRYGAIGSSRRSGIRSRPSSATSRGPSRECCAGGSS
jgi:prolyl-tRNA synthetase